jgi:hypothetical protein
LSRAVGALRLRLLAPAIALIVAATMIPTGLRHPSLIHIDNQFDPVDIVNNIILYLPLGFALAGSSLRRAFLYGLCLATCAEVLQLGYVDRIPSFIDIASNTAGAMLGYLVATGLRGRAGHSLRSLRIPRLLALAGIPLGVLATIMLLVYRPQPNFSNWSPMCRLLVGDELSGGRPWAGSISALQIYPFAMAPSQIDKLAGEAGTSASGKPNAPTAFPDGGLLPPTDLSLRTGHPWLSNEQQQVFFEALVKQSRMTLLVSMRPSNLEQTGPARIVTYSYDSFGRNFTLGQVHNGLTFRLRTPNTGQNGTEPALFTGPVLTPNHTAFVAVVYNGRVSSLYVDGKLVAHADLGMERPHLPKRLLDILPGSIPIPVIEVGVTEMLASSLLALGLFAIRGVPASRVARGLLGLVAGIAVGATVWAFAVSSPGLGVRIMLECVAAGLMIAASVTSETASRV